MPNNRRHPDAASERLTVNQNFRVSPVLSRAIEEDAAELALSTSAYLRACVYLAGPMLMQHPALADLNRRELAELAASICKILVIHPARVELGGGMAEDVASGETEGGA